MFETTLQLLVSLTLYSVRTCVYMCKRLTSVLCHSFMIIRTYFSIHVLVHFQLRRGNPTIMFSVAKHAVPCKNGKCVLSECVNLKLRREITNNARKLKRPGRSQIMSRRNSGKYKKHGRKPRP